MQFITAAHRTDVFNTVCYNFGNGTTRVVRVVHTAPCIFLYIFPSLWRSHKSRECKSVASRTDEWRAIIASRATAVGLKLAHFHKLLHFTNTFNVLAQILLSFYFSNSESSFMVLVFYITKPSYYKFECFCEKLRKYILLNQKKKQSDREWLRIWLSL